MLSSLPEAIGILLSLEGLLVLVLGTVLGIILGAMPGIGSTVAVAIVLPFTLTMGQAPAIILLLAVYAGSVYGGSIAAILINTPGTPQSAATCLDGYPMAQRGEAGAGPWLGDRCVGCGRSCVCCGSDLRGPTIGSRRA